MEKTGRAIESNVCLAPGEGERNEGWVEVFCSALSLSTFSAKPLRNLQASQEGACLTLSVLFSHWLSRPHRWAPLGCHRDIWIACNT